MNKIPLSEVVWTPTPYLRRGETLSYDYYLLLPEPLASWDVYDYWERPRIENMRKHLRQGMTLFDVGTESGWCNLVYATMVGAENMVLIEPTPEFWPNIKATWEANYGQVMPKGFYDGLISDRTTDTRNNLDFKAWPAGSDGDLIDRNKYQYIHDNEDNIPEMTIDEYVKRSGIVPDAITMDTEGSELLILKGARKTLAHHSPLLWVSIHPDLAERDYGTKPGQTAKYLKRLGYTGKHISTDHEEHWVFIKSEEA